MKKKAEKQRPLESAELVLPADLISKILDARSPEAQRFTAQLADALARISPTLVPRLRTHPLSEAIRAGVAAYPRLLDALGRSTDESERARILDALGEICEQHAATLEVVDAATERLTNARTPLEASLAARLLAAARDEGFLESQRAALHDERPSVVRVAAKLLGIGRHAPAVPELLALLRPDRMMLADVVLWALGEIGDERAAPPLHRRLLARVESVHTIEALGKIGSVATLRVLLPILELSTTEVREATMKAIARIVRKHDGVILDEALDKELRRVLERCLDRDPSLLARFHALLGISLLGGHIESKRILRSLGARLSAEELDPRARYLVERARRDAESSTPPAGPDRR